jgi:hypothetical protein
MHDRLWNRRELLSLIVAGHQVVGIESSPEPAAIAQRLSDVAARALSWAATPRPWAEMITAAGALTATTDAKTSARVHCIAVGSHANERWHAA